MGAICSKTDITSTNPITSITDHDSGEIIDPSAAAIISLNRYNTRRNRNRTRSVTNSNPRLNDNIINNYTTTNINRRRSAYFELSPLLEVLSRLDHTILNRIDILPNSYTNLMSIVINDVISPLEIIYTITNLYHNIINNVEVQSTPINGYVKIIINNVVNTANNRPIRVVFLDNYIFQENESNYVECPICLEDFKNGEKIKKLTCNHLFHSHCIISWFKHQQMYPALCPTCKAQIT